MALTPTGFVLDRTGPAAAPGGHHARHDVPQAPAAHAACRRTPAGAAKAHRRVSLHCLPPPHSTPLTCSLARSKDASP